jgi:hypothetical protein
VWEGRRGDSPPYPDMVMPPSAGQRMPRLLWRGWGEPFALAAGLWFRFGFRRFLNFFSAFVFASHG